MVMANTNKIKYTSGNTISNGAITNNFASLGVDTSVDYGPTSITGFWQGVTPNNSGYTIYHVTETEQPRIVVAQDDAALIFFANSFGGDVATVTEALNYFKQTAGYFVTNRKFDSITTSGMTLMYDPGLVQSYPKSGTTMDNLGSLGGGQNTPQMTLNNGVGYVNEKGGVLSYVSADGTYCSATEETFLNDFTYNVWFKVNDVTGPWAILTSRDNGRHQVALYANDPSGYYVNFYDDSQELDVFDESGAPQITLGKWHNMTVRHIEGETTQLYLDNVLIAENTSNTNLYDENTNNFYIGGTGNMDIFDGQIGHVARYDRALSVAEIEKNYNALYNRYYGALTGQTGFFMATLPGGSTFAYVILDPATGTVMGPFDTGISYTDYQQDDIKPLNHLGYGLYYANQNNNSDKIVQFIDAFGTVVDSYTGSTSSYNTDDLEGKVVYAHFNDTGVLKYFNGTSVGTYTYDPNVESVNVQWNDDGTSRDGTFVIQCISGNTTQYKLLNASNSNVISLPSYDNIAFNTDPRLYDNGDYVAMEMYDSVNNKYTSLDVYDTLGNLISSTDISSFNYNYRSFNHFGTNKFSILFSNGNDINQDYKIFVYNGTSVISTTHERGTNFEDHNSYSQHYDNPNQSFLSETLTYLFLPTNLGNSGPFTTTDYLDLLSVCNGTTGFTLNSIATGTTISFGYNSGGNVYSDFIVKPDGKLYAMLVLPSGVTYTELAADASIFTGRDKDNAGNYHIFRTETDNTHPYFYLVDGTTGVLLDTLTFTSFEPYSWGTNTSYTSYLITDGGANLGWYLNTSTNEFTQFSGSYQNVWTANTFFRGDDVFTDHPSIVMFNASGTARMLSETGLSNEFTLPATANSWSMYRGRTFLAYTYRSVDNNQPYARLIDFSGNTLNEFTDADDVNWDFWNFDLNNDVAIAVSGEGLVNGTLRVNIINPNGTTDQQVLSYSGINNYWREFNDWHWWD